MRTPSGVFLSFSSPARPRSGGSVHIACPFAFRFYFYSTILGRRTEPDTKWCAEPSHIWTVLLELLLSYNRVILVGTEALKLPTALPRYTYKQKAVVIAHVPLFWDGAVWKSQVQRW